MQVPQTMKGAYLPGNSTTQLREVPVPEPGHGEVLLRMKASTICGSDIRAIYREHLGKGPEAYQNKIAGHEPCGQIVKTGPGMKRFKEGDRVVVYHISGCGLCNDCRRGYMISCTSPQRAAYGWQRDGGMADYCLVEEKEIYGSWVTNIWRMEELLERLVRWNLHPEDLVTHRFPLDDVAKAYELMDEGRCGKVAVCFDEELERAGSGLNLAAGSHCGCC